MKLEEAFSLLVGNAKRVTGIHGSEDPLDPTAGGDEIRDQFQEIDPFLIPTAKKEDTGIDTFYGIDAFHPQIDEDDRPTRDGLDQVNEGLRIMREDSDRSTDEDRHTNPNSSGNWIGATIWVPSDRSVILMEEMENRGDTVIVNQGTVNVYLSHVPIGIPAGPTPSTILLPPGVSRTIRTERFVYAASVSGAPTPVDIEMEFG